MTITAIGRETYDYAAELLRMEREECEENLYLFLRTAWMARVLDGARWVDGWAIEAMADHLQAVVDGDIRRLLINVPPRTTKPVAADTPITTARGLVRLDEIVVGDHVLTHKGRLRPVLAVHRQGVLPVMRMTTRRGRTIVAAPDHPFLTPEGWRPLGEIGPDDVVAIAPNYQPVGLETVTTETARLLGYLIGDGRCRGTPNITVADDIEAADIEACARAVGFTPTMRSYRMASTGYLPRRISLTSGEENHGRQRGDLGPVRRFMMDHGLWGQTSYTKHVPQAVLQGSDKIVEAFIGAYWACDGYISTRGPKRDGTQRDDMVIGCDSVNRILMLEMQLLLLRVGVNSTIRKKVSKIKTKRQGDKYVSWSLTLAGQDDCWRFAGRIDIPHVKGEKLAEARRRFDFDRDLIGEVVADNEADGEAECLCLTVEEDASFVAAGFAVHNSWLCSVAFPAWCWAQKENSPTSGAGTQFLYASYGFGLSVRDSIRCRRLIKSGWYQERWGERFAIHADTDTTRRFSNDAGGERLITSIGAPVTGEGGAIIVVDDANAVNEVESEATIKSTNDWWDGTMPTRLNDAKTGAFVVVQQRCAEDDLSGHILDKEGNEWTHISLPMEYEEWRKTFVSVIGWKDPRETEGELLWPERFGQTEVDKLKRDLGPFRAASQLQQRPEPKGGGIIKRDWWQLWEGKAYPRMDYIVASLDTAYTEETQNDPSAITLWGIFTADPVARVNRVLGTDGRPIYMERDMRVMAPQLMLMFAWQEWLELHELVTKVADTCKKFNVDRLLIENKSSGKSVAQELRRIYGPEAFAVQLVDPKNQDKVARLYSVQHLFADMMVHAPNTKWAEKVISEVATFPKGKHDDLTDTCSMAIRHLRDGGLLERAPERIEALDASQRFTGSAPVPLYGTV